jgi:hypothetical protein
MTRADLLARNLCVLARPWQAEAPAKRELPANRTISAHKFRHPNIA